jgi:hypothetical protein
MSDSGDTDGMLHRFITDDHAERLLAGHGDDGDGELAFMASLFAAMRAPSQPGEVAGTDDLVARMATVVRKGGSTSDYRPQRRPVLAQLVTAKVAALAAVALFSAGAAAAATGHLPDPLQRTVSNTFSHVGVDLPSPGDKPTTTTLVATTTSTTGQSDTTTTPTTAVDTALAPAVGPDATGPAKTGLCTAFLNRHEKNLDPVAFRNLLAAATAAGQTVDEFCARTTDTTSSVVITTDETGKPTNPGHSGSTPAATAPGRPANPGNSGSTPAGTAPGKSGSTPAATSPGRTSSPTSAHGRP